LKRIGCISYFHFVAKRHSTSLNVMIRSAARRKIDEPRRSSSRTPKTRRIPPTHQQLPVARQQPLPAVVARQARIRVVRHRFHRTRARVQQPKPTAATATATAVALPPLHHFQLQPHRLSRCLHHHRPNKPLPMTMLTMKVASCMAWRTFVTFPIKRMQHNQLYRYSLSLSLSAPLCLCRTGSVRLVLLCD
jgi:hypothetical protein